MYSFRVEQAIKAAAILHKDQLRKGSVPIPYVTHLYAVALILRDYTEDEDTIVAALLHDTLEDTDYTDEELRDDFGGNVRDIVFAVTEPATENEKQLSWRERKSGYIKKLRTAPEAALLVAAADKIHNMRNMIEEYYDDHSRFMADFGKKIDDRLEMYQDISNVINSRLKNDILSEFNHVFEEYKNFVYDVKKSQERTHF